MEEKVIIVQFILIVIFSEYNLYNNMNDFKVEIKENVLIVVVNEYFVIMMIFNVEFKSKVKSFRFFYGFEEKCYVILIV